MRIDPEFKSLIPPLSNEEYQQLEANIVADGCRDPLVTWNDTLIDGHNRYEICTKHNLEFSVTCKEFADREEVKEWMILNQLGKRNLNPAQASYLRGLLYNESKKESVGRSGRSFGEANFALPNTAEKIAQETGVSPRTVRNDGQFATALQTLEPEVKAEILTGQSDLTKQEVIDIAKAPEVYVGLSAKEIKDKANEIRREESAQRHAQRLEKIAEITQGNQSVDTSKKYSVIYADPAWRYDFAKDSKDEIENHYPTMSVEEICNLPVSKIAGDDCVLYMWATAPKLLEAIEVIKAWGFTYKTHAMWDKQKIGMGYWFRGQHELLMVATKGNIPAPKPENRYSSVFSYPRGKHSAKPHEFYEVIENAFPVVDKVELFARNKREGWDSWGNQA